MSDPFGEKLRELRLAKEWTQETLAEKAGVPVKSLKNWEGGHRRPDLGHAFKLTRAFGISLDILGELAERYPLRKPKPPTERPAGTE